MPPTVKSYDRYGVLYVLFFGKWFETDGNLLKELLSCLFFLYFYTDSENFG